MSGRTSLTVLEAMGFAAAVDRGGVVEQSVEHTAVALAGAVPAELHTTIVTANSSPTGTPYHA